MASINELAARILRANGVGEFPARIGTTAPALADLARARMVANPNLFVLCQSLDASTDDRHSAKAAAFTNDDAKIIGFFLANNTVICVLNLSRNIIGDAGAMALGEALKTNAALTILQYVELSLRSKWRSCWEAG